MSAKVAVVRINGDYSEAFRQAVRLIGGLEGLNTPEREVTIKIGLFDPRMQHHTTIPALRAILEAFDRAPRISLVESDNYCGKALDRLECFRELFSERVQPCSLSDDPQARRQTIIGEEMYLSHKLLKPHVLISTHILRTFNKGSILKNLFGCTPEVKKARYHKNEIYANLLADIFEAAGGIDLAVMDGTYLNFNATDKKVPVGLLIAGKDAVAVETVGAVLAGEKPERFPAIQEFTRRGLGEGDIDQIEIAGVSAEEFSELKRARKELKKALLAAPRLPSLTKTIDRLIAEGWMDAFHCAAEVADELAQQGVPKVKKEVVERALMRRVGKTLEGSQEGQTWVYRRIRD